MRSAALLAALTLARLAGAQDWTPLPGPSGVRFVAVNPADARRVYTGAEDGLYTSADGGASWSLRTRGLPDPAGGRCRAQAAAFDPDRKKLVRIGLGSRLDSTRGCGAFTGHGKGARWKSLELDGEGVSALAIAAGSGDVTWAGTTGDGGDVAGAVLKRAGKGAWQVMLEGDGVDLDVTALAIDPRDPGVVYAATNNAGVARTTDGGATWTPIDQGLPRFDGLGNASPTGAFVFTIPLVLAADDPDTVHVGTLGYGSCCPDEIGIGGDVFTSRDGGATWTGSTSGLTGLNVLALASDPVRPGTLYAGTTDGVFRSPDRGATWQPFGLQGQLVWSLAMPGDGRAPYAATGMVQRRGL